MLRVRASAPSVSMVIVPLPDKVPLRVMPSTLLPPTVGLAPKGKEQSLLMVMMPLVVLMFTALKVALLQAKVRVLVPSNVTVPELWVKVPPVIVKFPATVIVPDVEVNVPPERVNLSLMSMVEFPPEKVPSAWI